MFPLIHCAGSYTSSKVHHRKDTPPPDRIEEMTTYESEGREEPYYDMHASRQHHNRATTTTPRSFETTLTTVPLCHDRTNHVDDPRTSSKQPRSFICNISDSDAEQMYDYERNTRPPPVSYYSTPHDQTHWFQYPMSTFQCPATMGTSFVHDHYASSNNHHRHSTQRNSWTSYDGIPRRPLQSYPVNNRPFYQHCYQMHSPIYWNDWAQYQDRQSYPHPTWYSQTSSEFFPNYAAPPSPQSRISWSNPHPPPPPPPIHQYQQRAVPHYYDYQDPWQQRHAGTNAPRRDSDPTIKDLYDFDGTVVKDPISHHRLFAILGMSRSSDSGTTRKAQEDEPDDGQDPSASRAAATTPAINPSSNNVVRTVYSSKQNKRPLPMFESGEENEEEEGNSATDCGTTTVVRKKMRVELVLQDDCDFFEEHHHEEQCTSDLVVLDDDGDDEEEEEEGI